MIMNEDFQALKGQEREAAVHELVETYYVPYRQCRVIEAFIKAYHGISLSCFEIERHVQAIKRKPRYAI